MKKRQPVLVSPRKLGLGPAVAVFFVMSAALAQTAPPAGETPPAPPAPTRPAPPAPGTQAEQEGTEGQQGPTVQVEVGAGGKKVYRITEAIRITGKIQKPEAFYVLQKSSINYDWQDLKQDFIPKILDSVSRSPF